MEFANKLIQLRKQKGYSQEMLADLLGVSRQAVGKWESGRAMPDIPKLIAAADLFGVTLDELVRDRVAPAPASDGPVVTGPLVAAASLRREYKSRTTVFGVPLVHICHGGLVGRRGVARGIIAIGDVAIGVVAFGGVAVGLVAVGGVAVGLLLAFAGFALGGLALGGITLGVYAFGGLAIGMWAFGGFAVAGQVAGGGLAIAGRVAVGGQVSAPLAFTAGELPATFEAFYAQVKAQAPATFDWLLRLIYAVSS